jgi:hypothetical protein
VICRACIVVQMSEERDNVQVRGFVESLKRCVGWRAVQSASKLWSYGELAHVWVKNLGMRLSTDRFKLRYPISRRRGIGI